MKDFPLVTISIINYNDKKFILKAIGSAVNQNYPNLEIIISDNNSTDGTKEEIGSRIAGWEDERKNIFRKFSVGPVGSEIKYIKNTENTGFGRPHNEAMRMGKGDFILLLNSDAIILPDYVSNVLASFADKKVGAVQGKLLRYNFDKNELTKSKGSPELNVIDTTGLLICKNRRIVCVGQGEADKGQFEKPREIFGVDGAVPIYRMEALEDVKIPILERAKKLQAACLPDRQAARKPAYEYFDEDFFMYKEDVDLAWRLRLAGWKAVYNPKAVACHGRGSGDSMAKNYLDIIKERRKINNRAKFLSFKHQRLMQIKNDFPTLLFTKHFPKFIIKEAGAWLYVAIFERFTVRVLADLYRDVPRFLAKRKLVMKKRRVRAKEMERWFV